MDISEKDFKDCKEISIDYSYLHPIVTMSEGKRTIQMFECDTKAKANKLFGQLFKVWEEVKIGTKKISE